MTTILKNFEMTFKNKRTLIPFISLVLWMAFIMAGYVSYDVNDDASLNLIAAGALGTGREYLIYSNVLLGGLFRILFSVFPRVNCYLWFYLTFNLVAIIAFCIVLTDRMKIRSAVITTVGINLLMAGEFYVHITYTKSAALYGTVGLILLLWYIRNDKKEKIFLLISYILIAFGSWIRWKSFALCVPIVIGIELINLIYDVVTKKRNISIVKYVPLLVAAIICIASIAVDSIVYRMDAGWDEFRKTDNLLIEMRDFNRYVFADAPDDYLAAGITENDFKMIKGYWMWNDPIYFNSDRLEQIKKIGTKYEEPVIRLDKSLVRDAVKEILWIASGKSYGIIFVVVLLLALIYGNASLWIKMVYVAVVACGEIYYMFCLDRVLWRAEVCTVMVALMTGAYMLSLLMAEGVEDKACRKSVVIPVFAVICMAFIATKTFLVDNSKYTNGDSKSEEFQKLTQTDGFFVVQSIPEYGMLLGAKDIFDITPANYKNFYSNIVEIGGTSQSPAGMYFAHKNGITNPIKDLINHDNVYYVGDEGARSALAAYMDEKYGPGLVWESVKVGDVEANIVHTAR